MTLLNFKIDKKKKEQIKKLIKNNKYKSISGFVKKVLDEKIKILESKKQTGEVKVPDWILDGKYYAIVNNSIVAVGDTPSEVSLETAEKFPQEQVIIKRKNAKFPHLEYVYSADIKNVNYWQYYQSGESTYPIFHVSLIKNDQKKTIYVIPDTAASLTLI
ncbi:MAG: DUF5678 domain-containing protein, partial [Candidatus Helarchaeota archaeon]